MSEDRRDAASALARGCVTSTDIEAVRRDLDRVGLAVAHRLSAAAIARDTALRARPGSRRDNRPERHPGAHDARQEHPTAEDEE